MNRRNSTRCRIRARKKTVRAARTDEQKEQGIVQAKGRMKRQVNREAFPT